MNNKTTKKNFITFKDEFKFWIEMFGVLKGFEFEFIYVEDEKEQSDSLATVQCDSDNRNVCVMFYKDWHLTKIDDYMIRKTAFHEVLEILFDPLESLVIKKNRNHARTEVHILIKVLENVLFLENYKRRFGAVDDNMTITK